MKCFRSLGLFWIACVFAVAACDGSSGGGGGNGGSGGQGVGGTSNGGSGGQGVGGAGNGGSGGQGDPCGGLGCASIVSPLFLTVVDSTTGAYVDSPTFVWNGNDVPATCYPSADGGAACARWLLQFAYGGTYAIDVSAAGYVDASVTVDIGGPKQGECCGVGDEVNATVTMQLQ